MSKELHEKRRAMWARLVQARSVYLDQEKLREVFRLVAVKAPGHERGDFLTSFAQAMIYADPDNFQILSVPAIVLAEKYRLFPQA